MSSPTQRTLALLRKEGWQAQVVEKWNPHSRTRLDLFGGIDVLACRPYEASLGIAGAVVAYGAPRIVGVQACAAASHAARKSKLLKEKKIAVWLAAGGRVEVWSWGKRGARGKRKTWQVRREAISLKDFVPEGAAA